jgi:hypothetical protein
LADEVNEAGDTAEVKGLEAENLAALFGIELAEPEAALENG